MKNKRIVADITSSSKLAYGNLSEIGRTKQKGVTFADLSPTIDVIFLPNIRIYLNTISVISNKTNLKRFRIALLDSKNYVQYKGESSSMTVNLESLPGLVLTAIRLTFYETIDNQPPKNIALSIRACAEKILNPTFPTTATSLTIETISPRTTPTTPGRH